MRFSITVTCLLTACAPIPTSFDHHPVVPERRPLADAPTSQVQPSSDCSDVIVSPELQMTGVPADEAPSEHRINFSQAALDAPTIAQNVARLFDSLRAGEADQTVVYTHAPRGSAEDLVAWLLQATTEERLCALRLTSLHYPNSSSHHVLATFDIGTQGRSSHHVEIELWRSRDHAWQINLERMASDLNQIFRLDRAEEFVRTHREIRIEHSVDPFDKTELTWTQRDGGMRVLCIEAMPRDTEPVALRCFQATWPASPISVRFTEDGFLCLGQTGQQEDVWVLRWPDGESHTGTCGFASAHLGGPTSALQRVAPEIDISPLHGITVASLRPEVILFSSQNHHRVCVSIGVRLVCSQPMRWDDANLARTDLQSADLAIAEDGSGWLGLFRHREEMGGAEMRAGDDALLVYRVETSSLTLHGVLPLGGYISERLEHEPEVRTAWTSDVVEPGGTRVDAAGCISVEAQSPISRTSTRARGRLSLRERRARSRPPAPDFLNGANSESVYEAAEIDTSGHWRFELGGGFQRIHSCPVR